MLAQTAFEMEILMWLRTLLDSLAIQSPRRPGRPGRTGLPRRSAAGRLSFEALEDRCVPASLAVADVTIVEGDTGTRNALVTVRLSAPVSQTVRVDYDTANGSARAGSDYTAVSGRLTFAPGETRKAILVPVTGDQLGEPDENLCVNLSGAKQATIADGRGVVTIEDDEPHISITDVSAKEGSSGTTPLTFTVSLSAVSAEPVSVNFATANGTATTADSDYLAQSGTVTFAPGETSRTITVEIQGDAIAETDETFFVNLSGPAADVFIADGQGRATILDDELRLSINDVSRAEGSFDSTAYQLAGYDEDGNPYYYSYTTSGLTAFTFAVSLSAPSAELVTVNFATQDGTAHSSPRYGEQPGDTEIDYNPEPFYYWATQLTFEPGETTKTITVWVVADFYAEPAETFFVNLTAATGAVIVDGQGIGTILDDDGWTPPPDLGGW
jgi:hypothetical protein